MIALATAGLATEAAPKKAGAQSRYYQFAQAGTGALQRRCAGRQYALHRGGVDPKTGKPPDDLEQQVRILLDGFKSVLAETGMTMDDLVFVQVFCPDLSLYGKFNDIYKTYFGKDYPARAFVGSGPLLRGGHFEMNGIAVKK